MKFQNIYKYMELSRSERQSHLRLDEECHEIGADSAQCRVLLAYTRYTTIPKGMKIYCCHACNNGACSNPNHLYWGTAKENVLDAVEAGTHYNARNKLKNAGVV